MIIWSRWGFLSFLAIGAGMLIGLTFATAIGLERSAISAAMALVLAAGFNALLAVFVYPRLDRPQPLTYTQPLPQPIRHENGRVQTHQVLPALDQDGQQLWTRPTSTLFFIPGRYWWMICLVIAVALSVVALFGR